MIHIYCRGSKENPQGVIRALKNLGGKNPYGLLGNMPYLLYYINNKKEIITAKSEAKEIIEDCFEEIQPSEVYKKGDILISKMSGTIIIFDSYDANNHCTFNGQVLFAYDEYKYPLKTDWTLESFRLMTLEQKCEISKFIINKNNGNILS